MRVRGFLAAGLLGVFGSAGWAQSPPAAGATKPLKLPASATAEKLADPKEAAKIADQLEKEYPAPQSEATKMLIAILRGSQLNGQDGWFGPAQSRYSWGWLAERFGTDPKKGTIARDKFSGPSELFDQLDRDGDGKIAASDLDWSNASPYVMQANLFNRIFRRLDRSGDGKVKQEELEGFFKALSKDKGHFTADDLRQAMIPRGPAGFSPGDAPSIPVLVKGLFEGEIGSMGEGPKPGESAPNFTLKTPDGKETISLSSLTGSKPVVVVLGNFTCGPFRGLYPDVDAVYRRHKDKANFIMVYVREAHPTDGWKMDSNARMGVEVKQPKTYADRVEVCALFRTKLEPGMPVVVDDVSDPAGTAYSGMPARLYVIDSKGKVAYKSGRGPFGFKPGEMEQALLMTLIEESVPAAPAPTSAPSASSKERGN